MFDLYPALDLRHGRVVRLYQGDARQETVYEHRPLVVARRWLEAGARWLHVVDLDAAFGEGHHRDLAPALVNLAQRYQARIQWGGGVRDQATLDALLQAGVHRVMVGSMAVKQPTVLAQALDRWGAARLVVVLDAKAGQVRIAGWRQATGLSPLALARFWADRGVRWFLYTDVQRDGTLQGPDVATASRIAQETRTWVVLAGGVARLEHVLAAREAGLAGVVVGRALYEGTLDLKEALQILDTL